MRHVGTVATGRVGSLRIPTAISATGRSGVGEGSERHADDVDEERGGTVTGNRGALEKFDVVSQITSFEPGIAEDDDGAGNAVLGKDGQGGIWRILQEAVGTLAPERDEVAGGHRAGEPLGSVAERDGRIRDAAQGHGAVAEPHALRVLHEEQIGLHELGTFRLR